ncbi:MAG: sugar transferase [Candidatus Electrothrix sp. YB6]
MTKRFFDLFLTLPGIIFISPLILLTALLVRIKIGKPIVFVQERPGLHSKPFRMYKFRTMSNERDNKGNLLPEKKRLLPLGHFLRATSLDELPELWNVLKGDMSLVGPRPLKMDYLPLYNDEQRQRHNIRPGITGWAQVNGRNTVQWNERFKLDVWYVNNQTLLLDIKIILLTLLKVFRKEGAAPEGGSSVLPPFSGND